MTFIEELKKLDEAATGAPWVDKKSIHGPQFRYLQIGANEDYTTLELYPEDARLIAFLRNHAADIAALVEAAQKSLSDAYDRRETRMDLRAALSRLNEGAK